MTETETKPDISIPERVTFKEFKDRSVVMDYGRGANKMFHVYYGKIEGTPYWKYKIYPYGYSMQPYDQNTKVNALKQAYKVLFEETRQDERHFSIREGEYKFAIIYRG